MVCASETCIKLMIAIGFLVDVNPICYLPCEVHGVDNDSDCSTTHYRVLDIILLKGTSFVEDNLCVLCFIAPRGAPRLQLRRKTRIPRQCTMSIKAALMT